MRADTSAGAVSGSDGCTVVAGYDGSSRGRAAVIAAGRRAGPSGRVFVVYAYRPPPAYLGSPYAQRRLTAARAAGRHALGGLLLDDEDLPRAQYVSELIAGNPASAIARVAAAQRADAIVVGASRPRRVGFGSRSVSAALRRSVDVPVIVMPDQPQRLTVKARSLRNHNSDGKAGPDIRIWW